MKMATNRQDPVVFQEAQQALRGIGQKNAGEQMAMLASGANALSDSQSETLTA